MSGYGRRRREADDSQSGYPDLEDINVGTVLSITNEQVVIEGEIETSFVVF